MPFCHIVFEIDANKSKYLSNFRVVWLWWNYVGVVGNGHVMGVIE